MDDRSKNKDQLINELEQMRQRVAVLERTETESRRIQEDLKKQNDELQFILDSVPAYIFYKDREGRLIRGNAAVARSADMPKEGWVGKTVFDLVPGLAESYYEDDMEVMTSGEPKRNIIEPFDTPKGLRWLRTSKIPTKDKEGKVNGLVGFSVDITDRIQAEEALRESEEKLRTIFDSSSDGIVVVDLEGKVVEANEAALRMTGYSRDDVIGRSALDLITEGERSEAMGVMTKIVQTGEEPAQRVQYTLVAADGREFMAEFGLAVLSDSLGNATGFVGSMRDVTERAGAEAELQSYRDRLEKMVEERTADLTVANKQLKQEVANRKRAEVAMRDSEERLRTTFESMGEGVLIVDLRGNIAEANRTALSMAKCSKKELIGRSIFQFIAPEERTQAMSELGAVLAAGVNRVDMEYTFVDAEEKRIDAEFSATLLRDSGGNPAGIIGIARDLTERKRMEMALKESEEKLRIMFESMGDAIVVIDLEGKIVEVNDRLVAMSGYESREEVLGEMPLDSLLRGFALGQWKISRPVERQVSATVEYVAMDRHGREFDVEAIGAMLRDAAGKPIGSIIALRDVSERKRMEKALREGEARYRELYKHMTSGVIVYQAINDGEDFIAKDFNSAAERISKLRREDFIGKSFLQAKPGIKKSGLFYVMQEVWRTGEPEYIPESHYEDEYISGWRENYIYKLPSGEVVTVYNDITDRKRMEEALRESEMKFRTIFETIPDGITVTGLEGRIIDQNRAGMRLGGYSSKGEVIGLSSFDFIVEEDRPRAVADMPEVLETGLSSIKQYRMRRKDGWEFDAEVIAAAMRGSFGSPTGLIVLTRDITERKCMQDALRESEEKLRIVFDAITDGIAVTDLQINVVQANQAVTRMAGYSTKDEVIGKNALEWITPDDLYKATGSMNEALKGQPIESGQFRIRNAQGVEFLGDIGISPLRDSSGNLSGFVTVIRDITERRRAEEALRQSEEKYRSLVDHMQEGYLVVRGEHIKYANERCADFLGIPVDKIIGKSIWEFVVPADMEKAKQTGEVFTRGGATSLQEFNYYREDGRTVPMEANLKAVSYEGQPALAVVLRDITERKQMEREIRESEEKLRLMFETMRDGVVLTDISGKIIDVNEAIVRIGRHGSKEKLMGRVGFNLVADKDRDRLSKAVTASLAGGEATGMWEAKFTRGDGTEFDAEMTGAMMRDSSGKPAGLIGVIRDITERKRMEEALQGSEEKLRFMFASMIDAVVVVDLEGKITELNDAALRMTGYSSREEVIGKNAFDFIAERDRARALEDLAKSLDTAPGFTVQYKFVDKDGKEYEVEAAGNMLFDSGGNAIGFINVVRDITERKRMQEELRQSEEKLRAMFASMIDVVTVVDLDGRIKDMNDAALRLTGYSTKEEVIGKNAFDFIAEEDRARALEDMTKALEVAPGFTVQYKFMDKDGKRYDVEATGNYMLDSDGKVSGLVAVVRDITERMRMQEELRKSEEKLRSMFEAIGDAVTITDLKGIILDENEAAVRMAGFTSKGDLIGRNGFELIAEKDRARAIETIQTGFAEQDTLRIEYALLRKDGSQWGADASLALIRDNKGKPTGVVAVTKDITESKRMQEELRQSEEKLRAIFESIGDALIVVGIDGSVQDVNAEACRMLGCRDKAEAMGRRGWEFLTAGDRSRSKEYASRLFAEGQSETMEFTLKDPDGRDIYVDSRATLIRDTAGKPVGIVGISRDITERKRMEEALRESEEKLRTMFEAIEDGITVTDLKGNIVQHNEAARQMLGYGRRDKFIGRKGLGFIAKKDRTRAEQYMRSAIENERGGTIEYSLLAKDGTEVDAEVHTALIRGSSGNPNSLVGVARDITERKRMQEALRESEEKLRFMFDSIADGMILVDLSGNVQEVNAAAARMAGYSDKEEMIGRNAFDFIAERDRDRALAENMKNIAEGRGSTVVYTAVDRNGAELTVEAMGAMLRDVAGNPIGFITVIRDITERMRMQEALRESEEKLRFMFESIADGVVSVDLQGNIRDVNPAFVQMTGYGSKEEMLGRNAIDLVAPKDSARAQEQFVKDIEVEQIGDLEYSVRGKSGKEFDADVSAGRLLDREGKPVGFIVAVRDVSERKHMQEALRGSEERLRFMFESMGDAIVVIDLEGKITEVNERLIAMSGYESREEVLGEMPLSSLLRGFAQGQWEISRTVGRQVSATVEYVAMDRHGKEFDVEANGAMLRDAAGKPAGSIIALRDVSERKIIEQKLRDSEEKLRTIFETSPDFIMSLDRDGKLLFINHTVPEMTVEQAIGTSAYDYILPEARKDYKETVEQIFLTGETASIETSGLGPGGRTSYYETRFAPVVHDRKVVSITLISTDITERKLAGEALRESEEKLRFMFESMGDSIVVIDAEGKIVEVNEKLIAMSGYESREEVLGRNAFEFVTERDRARAVEDFTQNMERQISATIEYVSVDRYGREFDVEANGAMLRDAAGNTVGFIIAIRDVSERKIMEQKLRDSEEMARGMLESAATGIYLVQNGKFEYVSPMFANISGYTNDELIGTPALGYVHPDDREMVREKAVESLKGKSGLPYEFRFVRKDGAIVWILEKVASIQYRGKRATIASFMDITEHRRADQALRESEEKLRGFMDSATDYFTIWDAKLNLVDLNESALHYPLVDFPGKIQRESVIGKSILRLEPTIRETDRYDRYMEVIRTGKPFFAEDIIPHTKLGDIHMAISAFKVGEGLGIITTDVTERRRSEEELRKSKVALEKRTNQLLALQKVTASIQSTLSLSDVLQQVAEGVVDNLGYDQSMLFVVDEKADVYQGRAFFSKDRPKYREGVEGILEQALSDIKFPRKRGYSMGLDESMDGKVVITPNFSALSVPPLDKQQANAIQKFLGANTIVSMPLFAMERHVGGILAFTARDDIAEPDIEPLRLLADQAGVAIVNANIYEGAAEMAQRLAVTGTLSRILGSSLDIREVYKAFVEEIHNVIDFERASIALVEGDRLRFLAVSPDVEPGGGTMMPVAGSPTEWVIQHKLTNIEHDFAVERQFSIDSVYAEGGMRSAICVPLISKGEAFGSFDLVSRSPNAYGEREQGILEQVAGSVAAAIENSRLFIRIKEHEAELVKAYEELKKAQEYMVQAERLRALGELAGGVAHDFNNVLAIILGRAQLALEDVEDAKLKKDLQIIEQTALDAATTVRRLQDFARVRVDRGFETVDLNEVVEGALQMVESRRMELKETRGVVIDVNADLGEVPSVQGEAAELREALVNIIFNAIDAMPKGGSITVKSRQDKEGVLLSISDTGEGIPDDVKGKIFDPFFTTRPQKGSGLGLSVTYGIITRHGGRIEVESRVGEGATFYIWLPMAIGVKAAKRPEQKVAVVKSAEVLLVDDDPEVSEVLQRMLQQMGHRVTGVNSGEAAVNAFEAGHYDLVVTDLGMPDMSGREVAAAVKDIKPGTPVLLITGWGVQLDPSELPEIDGIVAKPFSKEVLREQVAKLLPTEGGVSEGKQRKKKGPR